MITFKFSLDQVPYVRVNKVENMDPHIFYLRLGWVDSCLSWVEESNVLI